MRTHIHINVIEPKTRSALADVLRKRVRELEAQVQSLKSALAELEGGTSQASGRGPTVVEAVSTVLRYADGPVSIQEILASLQEAGRPTTIASLQTLFTRRKDLFVRAGKGHYRLAEPRTPGGTPEPRQEEMGV